jgi:hypothetical protein
MRDTQSERAIERCLHDGTDGTVACQECGVQPGQFISDAADWLCNHDGAEVEDPGYFN